MKPIGMKQQRELVRLITAAYESGALEHAAFDLINGTADNDPLPRSEREVTAFIKRRTRLYRHSWILSPLEEALEILNGAGNET